MSTSIVEMCPQHVPCVAHLHMACLGTPFSGTPGSKLLEAYYRVVARQEGAIGYVAEEDQVIGFVCGVWDQSLLRRKMLQHQAMRLAYWGSAQAFAQPLIALDLARRVMGASRASAQGTYELRPVVVASAWRRRGIGRLLVSEVLADAGRRGAVRVQLAVDQNNLAAQALYSRQGFRPIGEDERNRSRLLYVWDGP